MDQPVVSRILPSGRNVVAATLAVTLMMPNAAAFAFSGTPSNGQSTNADAFSAASLASSDQQNQIDELESACNQAKAEFDSADAANQQVQADLAAAQKKRDDAASSLSDAQAKDTSAQAALKSAQDAQTQADKDRASAAAGVSSASAAVDSAKQATQAKQSALDTAKSAQAQADSVNATAQSKVATAQQAASQAQAAYDAAKANEGTVEDFFTSLGDSSANDLINNCKYASSTHLDQANDATSLDNVAQSFQFIKECNAIRKANGLSELKVTSGMMAMAIADCNWSSTNIAHAGQFNVGENLAWGYGTSAYRLNDSSNLSSNSNPFNGWYDVEKNIYDTGADGVTGHYENIVNTSYTVTGFSYRTGGTYPTTFGQTFSCSSGSYKSYTVSEYEVLFNAWRESRTASEKKALELANAGVTAAQEAASVTQAQADSAASAT